MTHKQPVISVTVPAYNAQNYIQECLDSLYNQKINQELEIIVVNDGSTDVTADILAKQNSKIKVLSHENRGVCKTRNTGFRASIGSYLASLDADDLYHQDKLKRQLDYLQNNPGIDMVFCKVKQFISPELAASGRKIPKSLEVMNAMNFSGGLYRSSVFEKVGYIDESLHSYGEFIDWFARAKDLGVTYHIIDEILLKRRVHNTNLGKLKPSEQIDYLKVLRAKLKRAKDMKNE